MPRRSKEFDGMAWYDPSEAERKAVVAKQRKGHDLAYAPTGTSLEAGKMMKVAELEGMMANEDGNGGCRQHRDRPRRLPYLGNGRSCRHRVALVKRPAIGVAGADRLPSPLAPHRARWQPRLRRSSSPSRRSRVQEAVLEVLGQGVMA
jgi:hypothetical protein